MSPDLMRDIHGMKEENETLRQQLAECRDQITEIPQLMRRLAECERERDELMADAKRYQWLRDKLFLDGDLEETTIDVSNVWEFGTFSSVDKFIDAALAKLGADKKGEK